MHGIGNHLCHYRNIGQGNPPIEYPTLLGGQSRPATPQAQMAYQGSSSTEVSPFNGGTQ